MAVCKGVTMVTSIAASLPPDQWGTAGRRSSPGSRNLSSLTGPSPAATAVLNKASLRLLCRLILSPPVPQHRAWSPRVSLGRRQVGQGPSVLKTGRPRRYFTAGTNSAARRWRPGAVRGGVLSESPAVRERHAWSCLPSQLQLLPPLELQTRPPVFWALRVGLGSFATPPG